MFGRVVVVVVAGRVVVVVVGRVVVAPVAGRTTVVVAGLVVELLVVGLVVVVVVVVLTGRRVAVEVDTCREMTAGPAFSRAVAVVVEFVGFEVVVAEEAEPTLKLPAGCLCASLDTGFVTREFAVLVVAAVVDVLPFELLAAPA